MSGYICKIYLLMKCIIVKVESIIVVLLFNQYDMHYYDMMHFELNAFSFYPK